MEKARREGFVTTILNRRRYLPEINASNFGERSFRRTDGHEHADSGIGGRHHQACDGEGGPHEEKGVKSRLLLQVHDELVFEVPEDELTVMKELVQNTMEQAVRLSVPLKVQVSVGSNWYEAK